MALADIAAGSNVQAAAKPTPTAPMPGDIDPTPPPSIGGWIWTPTPDPYPGAIQTPTPGAYPEQVAVVVGHDKHGDTDSFTPDDAGLWAWIWDLFR